jgi:hypothetical protein
MYNNKNYTSNNLVRCRLGGYSPPTVGVGMGTRSDLDAGLWYEPVWLVALLLFGGPLLYSEYVGMVSRSFRSDGVAETSLVTF